MPTLNEENPTLADLTDTQRTVPPNGPVGNQSAEHVAYWASSNSLRASPTVFEETKTSKTRNENLQEVVAPSPEPTGTERRKKKKRKADKGVTRALAAPHRYGNHFRSLDETNATPDRFQGTS